MSFTGANILISYLLHTVSICVKYIFESILKADIAPSTRDLLGSGINKSLLIWSFVPKPLHSSQAPYGALNENNLGSSSGIE